MLHGKSNSLSIKAVKEKSKLKRRIVESIKAKQRSKIEENYGKCFKTI